MIVAKLNAPPTEMYVRAYAIGYFYAREFGDDELGRVELAEEYGESNYSNMMAYVGFEDGYDQGVSDFIQWEYK